MNRKMDRKPWSIAILMVLLTGTLLNFVSPFMHMQNSPILAYAKANEDTRNDRMKVDIQPAQVKYNLALEKSAQARSDAIQADKAAQNASEYAQNLINRADIADKKAKAASEPASDGTNGKLNNEGKNSISDQAHRLHIQAQYAIKKAKNLEADAKKLTEAANNAQKETEAARKEVEHLKQNSKSENEGRKTSEGLTPTASGKSKQNGNAKKEGTSIDHTNKKTKDRIDDNLSHKNKELKITNGQKSNQSVQIKESGTGFDDRKAEAVTSLYDKSTNQFNNKATSPRPEPNKMKSTDISNNLLSDSTMNERIENETFRLKSENITSQQVERDGPDKDGNYFGSSTVGNTPKNENRSNFAQNLEIVTNANIQDLNNTLVYNSTSCDIHSQGKSGYKILPDSSSSSNCLASNIFGNSNSSNYTERVSVPAIYRGSPVCDVTLLPINASENNGLVAKKWTRIHRGMQP